MKTVYVIGAGASVEAGLPSGDQLKKEISEFLECWSHHNSDPTIKNHKLRYLIGIAKTNGNFKKAINTCNQIADSMTLVISIDNYIDNHRTNPSIASYSKIAILERISQSEKTSKTYKFIKQTNKGFSLENSWYPKLFSTLSQNCDKGQFIKRLGDISFIIFNYDRCVESFLVTATQVTFGIAIDEAKKIIDRINFIHPYGKLGSLDENDETGVPFGADISPKRLEELIPNIKTFTEGIDKGSIGLEIEDALFKSERVIFLGFAFHPLNMKHFKHDLNGSPAKEIYATTYGMSESDIELVENQLNEIFNTSDDEDSSPRIRTKNVKCKELFIEYQLSLGYEHKKRPQRLSKASVIVSKVKQDY